MNKTRFRIIFNKTRGMLMAVAEHIASAGKSVRTSDASASGHVGQANNTTVTLKPTHFAVLCHLGLVSFVSLVSLVSFSGFANLAHADILADKSAPKNQQPIILNAPNGVPLVNIQTPSAAGVSRNTYSQFDVNANGAILNNSRSNVQTQLGGWVQGNPYLATGSARIILNEVNSNNPSLLNGYVEVAGSRAQVVIANTAGISCNGCGFINASRTTLTTGTPIMNNGDLMGYRVGGGAINFLGTGLDTTNSNYTDVIARAVNVNAGLWAQNLNIITGSNQVNVASNGDIAGMTTISPNATLPDGSNNPTPNFAIDVAALGGMYAGKIHLTGTEFGVGVRNAGNIGARVGEVTIDVNGMLTNSNRISSTTQTTINAAGISNTGGTLSAGQLLNINANSLTGDGQLISGGDATVTLTSDYAQTSTGKIQANGNLTFTTTGNLTNQSSLLAGNTLTLNAANIDNTATAEITGLNTQLNAANTLTNRGLIDGENTFITANTLNNIGTGSIFGNHVAIAANTLNNQDETVNGTNTAAVIAARTRLDIGASDISNRNDSLIFSAGDMAIGGSLDANHQAAGQTAVLNNAGATIEALGNLSLNVAQINNTNTNFTTQYVRTSIASTLAESVDVRGNIGSPAPAAGNTRQYQLSYFSTDGALLFGRIYNYDEVDHFYLDGSGFVHLVLKAGIANDGMTDANTFMQYNSGSIVYETQMLTTQPGQILAGSNMQINANNILNSDSKIIAGGTFNANVVTLNNQETLGSRSTQYGAESAFFRTRESCNCSRYFQYPNYPAPLIESINLGSTTYGAVSTVTGSGTTVATLTQNSIPTNSLFTPTNNPQSGYLLETNPRFANYRNWLSSDYMLQALNLDPAITQKRLGDGFYEQRLIREQINNLTGLRFLVGYADDETQYQALMTNGATFADAHQLTIGVALTAEQIAQLTSDIVWLVEQTVTLPDGSQAQALVPQVYARLQAGDLSPSGSLIAGQTLNLNVSGNIINGGDLAGREALNLNAENIHNINGRIRANNTQLNASNDINNLGGSIEGGDTLTLNAGNNINIESTTASSTLAFDLDQGNRIIHVDNKRTNIDRVAGLYITNSSGTGLLVASAGNDINLQGAVISNLGSNTAGNASENSGTTIINAGNNLNLGTITTTTNNSYVRDARNYNKNASTQEVGTVIQTDGDLTLNAGNNLSARAANVTSDNGTLTATAGNDLTIEAGKATYASESASYKKKSGTFGSKKKTTRDTANGTDVISSTFSGNSVDINAGNNLTVIGSNIVGTNDVNLNVGNEIALLSPQNQSYSRHQSDSQGSFGSKSHRLDEVGTLTHTATEISAGGNLNIISTGNQTIEAARFNTGGDLTITSTQGSVSFNAVKDLLQQTHEKSSSNLVWQSAKGHGSTDETIRQSQFAVTGQTLINAAQTVKIDIQQVDAQSVHDAITAMVNSDPRLAWLQAEEAKGNIDWHQVKAIHDSWEYDQSGLGPGAALAVAIVMSIYAGPAGAAMLGLDAAAVAGSVAAIEFAATSAAIGGLATTSTLSLISNKGDLGAVFADITSSDAINGYLAAGLSAGVSESFGATYGASRLVAQTATGCVASSISGGDCTAGATSAAIMSSLAWIGHDLRQNQIESSLAFKDICDSNGNCLSNTSGVSAGIDGDGLKIAGSRVKINEIVNAVGALCEEGACGEGFNLAIPANLSIETIQLPAQVSLPQLIEQLVKDNGLSPFGGIQGSQGYLFGRTYNSGSFTDKLLESFSGPHDFFNSFHYYDSLGNNLSGVNVTEMWNKLDLFLAAPFATGTLFTQYPAFLPAIQYGIYNNIGNKK